MTLVSKDTAAPCGSWRGRSGGGNTCAALLWGDPFQDPRGGSGLALGHESSEESHRMAKQGTLLGRDPWVESRRRRDPRGLPCLAVHSPGSHGEALSFQVFSGQSF